MSKLKAKLEIIDGNPFVFLPETILNEIFTKAEKNKGPIPVKGTVNGKMYRQTLLKYNGFWRLYINMQMLRKSPERIGETITLSIEFDPSDRSIEPHPKLVIALSNNASAKKVFDNLPASRQKEIVRYISFLKKDESIDRNIKRAIGLLNGENSFVGREKP